MTVLASCVPYGFMDWIADYLDFCFSHGFGGLILLGITGFVVLLVVVSVLAGVAQAGRAIADGWRSN